MPKITSDMVERLNGLRNLTVMYQGAEYLLGPLWRGNDDGSVTYDCAASDPTNTAAQRKTIVITHEYLEGTVKMWEKNAIRTGLNELHQAQMQVHPNSAEAHKAQAEEAMPPTAVSTEAGVEAPKLEPRSFIVFWMATIVRTPKPSIVLRGQNPMAANKPQVSHIHGDEAIQTPGHYLVKSQVVDYLRKKIVAATGAEVPAVAITNIVEVSEGDMQVWELPLPVAEETPAADA